MGVLDLNLEGCKSVVGEIEEAGGKAIALQASIADRAQVVAAVNDLRAAFGPIAVVVNNAGITGFVKFRDITDEAWDRMMEVNLKGTFIVTQVVLPDMEASQWGRIINISSSSALTGTAELTHYSASKGGMIVLTRSLALELGPLGITVNNIAPGSIVNTEMADARMEQFSISREDMSQRIPVRRTGEPEDVANAVVWLASDDSGYVTGQTIGVNGGRAVT